MHIAEIPSRQAAILEKKGVTTYRQLMTLYPKRYYDMRSPRRTLSQRDIKEKHAFVGVMEKSEKSEFQGQTYVKACVRMEDGKYLNLKWIGYAWRFMYGKLSHMKGQTVTVYGKLDAYYANGELVYSILFPPYVEEGEPARDLFPVWEIPGIADTTLQHIYAEAEPDDTEELHDYLPKDLQKLQLTIGGKKVRMPALWDAAKTMCIPEDWTSLEAAKNRFVFDDMLYYACRIEELNRRLPKGSPVTVRTMAAMYNYIDSLPYKITKGQREAIMTFADDIKEGLRVDGIVQGDVGCGKTTVALALMFLMAGNGYQAVLCAPSLRVATQHYGKLKPVVEAAGYEAVLLTGDLKGKERKNVLAKIASGEAKFIVGTHAVLSGTVKYKNLALEIVDEEHQFGVDQKNVLYTKGIEGMHVVHMSATPLPATAAKTAYSDKTKLVTILDKPEGRKDVLCCLIDDMEKAMRHVWKEVKDGHQAYVICPLVTKSELETMEGVASVEEVLQRTRQMLPNARVEGITGKTKKDAAEAIMDAFTAGEIDVLVATTIVGVGVDVPNATDVVICSPERFGLSQLHQIRGRVGRGDAQGYCILVAQDPDAGQRERFNYFCSHKNGMEVAEKDAELRGEGNYVGTEQSGNNYYIELIKSYPGLYEFARKTAAHMADHGLDSDFTEGYEAFAAIKPAKRRKQKHATGGPAGTSA